MTEPRMSMTLATSTPVAAMPAMSKESAVSVPPCGFSTRHGQ